MMRNFTTSFVTTFLSLALSTALAGPQSLAKTRGAGAVVQEKTQPELRQEAAEDRAEFSFGVRLENAKHQYDVVMRKCGRMHPSEVRECGAHALLDYRKSRSDAAEAFEESHAKAVALGGLDTTK